MLKIKILLHSLRDPFLNTRGIFIQFLYNFKIILKIILLNLFSNVKNKNVDA